MRRSAARSPTSFDLRGRRRAAPRVRLGHDGGVIGHGPPGATCAGSRAWVAGSIVQGGQRHSVDVVAGGVAP
jgi:hypothetical protein